VTIFVLTYEYSDKSRFYVCGTTANGVVASAWRAAGAGDGSHKVYRTQMDSIMGATVGYEEWK
jgi:hypothetical protein